MKVVGSGGPILQHNEVSRYRRVGGLERTALLNVVRDSKWGGSSTGHALAADRLLRTDSSVTLGMPVPPLEKDF
jgi:hypothetical protein